MSFVEEKPVWGALILREQEQARQGHDDQKHWAQALVGRVPPLVPLPYGRSSARNVSLGEGKATLGSALPEQNVFLNPHNDAIRKGR